MESCTPMARGMAAAAHVVGSDVLEAALRGIWASGLPAAERRRMCRVAVLGVVAPGRQEPVPGKQEWQNEEVVQIVDGAVRAVGAKHVGDAARVLAAHGREGAALGKRLSVASRARNRACHPDAFLYDDIVRFWEGGHKGDAGQPVGVAGSSSAFDEQSEGAVSEEAPHYDRADAGIEALDCANEWYEIQTKDAEAQTMLGLLNMRAVPLLVESVGIQADSREIMAVAMADAAVQCDDTENSNVDRDDTAAQCNEVVGHKGFRGKGKKSNKCIKDKAENGWVVRQVARTGRERGLAGQLFLLLLLGYMLLVGWTSAAMRVAEPLAEIYFDLDWRQGERRCEDECSGIDDISACLDWCAFGLEVELHCEDECSSDDDISACVDWCVSGFELGEVQGCFVGQ